jgi:cyclase
LLQKEKNPKKIREYKNDILTYKDIQNPDFKLRPPDILLYDKMKISGTTRSVEIINIGNAHAYDDILAYFPEEKICFMGDLLFAEPNPEWANGINGMPWSTDPEHLKEVMRFYLEQDLEVYVPGHGSLCTKKEVNNLIDFIDRYFINT